VTQDPHDRPQGSTVTLWLVFAAVIGSFLLANLLVLRGAREAEGLSNLITENSAPSIEHLSHMRRSALQAELWLVRASHASTDQAPFDWQGLDRELDQLRSAAEGYLRLEPLPGERTLRLRVQRSAVQFEDAAVRARNELRRPDAADSSHPLSTVVPALRERLLEDASTAIALDARVGRAAALQMRELRRQNERTSLVLNGFCGVLAVALGWLLQRQLRARRALLDAHTRSLRERAEELEQFAGRVAHDIRNPIAGARLACELALLDSTEEPVRRSLDTSMRSLSRAEAVISGLLDFARAGGRPDPGATARPQALISELIEELAPEAQHARIELRSEPAPPVLVSCSSGVYLSMLANLVRNAIKYMGDAPTRRITVRVSDRHGCVRTEVEDTGPGIPAETHPSLFASYFRVHREGEGLGLGLATVKKLAESHGGSVGVSSAPGRGTTIWFEVVRAGAPALSESGSDAARGPATAPGAALLRGS
jgi:signal transduction histidine kinase